MFYSRRTKIPDLIKAVQNNSDINKARELLSLRCSSSDFPANPNQLLQIVQIIQNTTNMQLSVNNPPQVNAAILYRCKSQNQNVPFDTLMTLLKENLKLLNQYTDELPKLDALYVRAGLIPNNQSLYNLTQTNFNFPDCLIYDFNKYKPFLSLSTSVLFIFQIMRNINDLFEQDSFIQEMKEIIPDLLSNSLFRNNFLNNIPNCFTSQFWDISTTKRAELICENLSKSVFDIKKVANDINNLHERKLFFMLLSRVSKEHAIELVNVYDFSNDDCKWSGNNNYSILPANVLEYFTIDENSSENYINKLLVLDKNFYKDQIVHVISKLSYEKPEYCLRILKKIKPITEEHVEYILQHLPSKFELTKSYCIFLQQICEVLPDTNCYSKENHSQIKQLNSFKNEWEEDKTPPNQNIPQDNIWEYPSNIGICTSNQNTSTNYWFNCYTCKMTGGSGCCLPCAFKCHKGHKIAYVGKGSYRCTCSPPICQFEKNQFGGFNLPRKTITTVSKLDLKERITHHLQNVLPSLPEDENEKEAIIDSVLEDPSLMELILNQEDFTTSQIPENTEINDSDSEHECIYDNDQFNFADENLSYATKIENEPTTTNCKSLGKLFEKLLTIVDQQDFEFDHSLSKQLSKAQLSTYAHFHNISNSCFHYLTKVKMENKMSFTSKLDYIVKLMGGTIKLVQPISDNNFVYANGDAIYSASFLQMDSNRIALKNRSIYHTDKAITQIEKDPNSTNNTVAFTTSQTLYFVECRLLNNQLQNSKQFPMDYTPLLIHWIPEIQSHIMVANSKSIEVYDSRKVRKELIAKYIPPQSYEIFSACWFKLNNNSFALVSMKDIGVGIVDFSTIPIRGTQQITTLIPYSYFYSSQEEINKQITNKTPVLSYCEENDLIFLSFTPTLCVFLNTSDISNYIMNSNHDTFKFINIAHVNLGGTSGQHIFAGCTSANTSKRSSKNILFFYDTDRNSTQIYTAEFTDKGLFTFTYQNSNITNNSKPTYATIDNKLYAYYEGYGFCSFELGPPSDNKLSFKSSNNLSNESENIQNEQLVMIANKTISPNPHISDFTVPPSFWTQSKQINNLNIITKYLHESKFINESINSDEKRIYVKSSNPKDVIVGFRVRFKNNPQTIQIFDRLITCEPNEEYIMIPLRKSEVGRGKMHCIKIPQNENGSTDLRNVDAFCLSENDPLYSLFNNTKPSMNLNYNYTVPSAVIDDNPFISQLPWLKSPNLLDYNEFYDDSELSPKDALLLFLSHKLQKGSLSNLKLIEENLYAKTYIGLACRNALMKSEEDPYNTIVKSIQYAVNNDKISKTMKPILQRDILLLNEDDRKQLKKQLFENGVIQGTFSLELAFCK